MRDIYIDTERSWYIFSKRSKKVNVEAKSVFFFKLRTGAVDICVRSVETKIRRYI